MKKILILLSLSISLFAVEQKQEGVGWLDVFSYNENSKKPRVLLIGDSIVRQYIDPVRSGLKNKYIITRLSTSKSICSSQYIKQLDIAMTQPYDIILINNGLHDFLSSNNKYEKCYLKVIHYLFKTNPKSKIMLISTTGVRGNKKRNDIVIQRNKSLKKISKTYHLSYIDLYSIIDGKDELFKDTYHYKIEGVDLLAKKMISSILQVDLDDTKTHLIYFVRDQKQ